MTRGAASGEGQEPMPASCPGLRPGYARATGHDSPSCPVPQGAAYRARLHDFALAHRLGTGLAEWSLPGDGG